LTATGQNAASGRPGKERLDVLVTERGLAENRDKALRLILAGLIRVDGHTQTKAGQQIPRGSRIELRECTRFVSRGGDKLEAAFAAFNVDVNGLTCIDVGASTGGFTDCMLQHGAARVFSVDVGRDQLHWKLGADPRVVAMNGINARYLKPSDVPCEMDFASIDVSFISLTKVLPAVIDVLKSGGSMVTLIKPQFEAEREQVEAGGVVRDAQVRAEVVESVRAFGVRSLGLEWRGVCESPVLGPAGNVEFLGYWRKA
jgi:23S rRNA (cytidine1920-2'-O)/16S rRNA (cytidine1409-2'-O)-methyltransferase